jgi:hypothetical protein
VGQKIIYDKKKIHRVFRSDGVLYECGDGYVSKYKCVESVVLALYKRCISVV